MAELAPPGAGEAADEPNAQPEEDGEAQRRPGGTNAPQEDA
jgi:hypothetical protein